MDRDHRDRGGASPTPPSRIDLTPSVMADASLDGGRVHFISLHLPCVCDFRSSAKSTSSTFHLYMSNHVMINCFYTATNFPMLATKCKDEKWTGLPSLSSSNHKHRAGVKK